VLVIGAGLSEIHSADRAETRAVLPAEQHRREREREGISCPRRYVQHVSFEIRRGQLLTTTRLRNLAGVDLERGRGIGETAHAGAAHGRAEAQPQGVAVARGSRDVEDGRDELRRDAVALAAKRERLDGHRDLQPACLASGQMEAREVEGVRA
jgi:hypothetical protein